MTKKVYNKQKYFSVITKNSNWYILTKNLVTFKGCVALMIKNFNILGFWGFTEKYDFYVTDCLKRGAGQLVDLEGGRGVGKKEGVVFLRGGGLVTLWQGPHLLSFCSVFGFLNPVKRRKKSWS